MQLRRAAKAATATGAIIVGYAAFGGLASASVQPFEPTSYSAVRATVVATKSLIANQLVKLTIAGRAGVPTNALEVALSVQVSAGSSAGDLTVYTPGAMPSKPTITWAAGQTVTVPVTVALDSNGQVAFQNDAGTATMTVSAVGYYTTGAAPDSVTSDQLSADGSTTGQILTSDGSGVTWQTPDFQPALTATKIVSPTGSATADGAALAAALTSGAYRVVYAEAGTYDLGSSTLSMASGVSLIGAGDDQTFIVSEAAGTAVSPSGTSTIAGVNLAVSATTGSAVQAVGVPSGAGTTLRDDTFSAANPSGTAATVSVTGTGALTVDDSTLTAAGGSFTEAFLQNDASPTSYIRDSTLVATGPVTRSAADAINAYGPVQIQGSNVTTTASGGGSGLGLVSQNNAAVTADSSRITAPTDALWTDGGTISVGASMVSGGVVHFATGVERCAASYNASYVALGADCT